MKKIYGVTGLPAPDGKFYYVYRITDVENRLHYYGKRSAHIQPLDDLGKIYFSSSTDDEFIKEQSTNPSKFKYKVIHCFSSCEESAAFECYLHEMYNVAHHPSFINKYNARLGAFDATNRVTVIDKDGNTRSLSREEFESSGLPGVRQGIVTLYRNDEKINVLVKDKHPYIAAGWSTHMTNKTAFRDASGKVVICDIEEAKKKSYFGINKGKVPVRDKSTGETFMTYKGDPRINHELECVVGKPGFTTFKDKDGNFIKASVDDPRVKSGELVGASAGRKIKFRNPRKPNSTRKISIFTITIHTMCDIIKIIGNIDEVSAKLKEIGLSFLVAKKYCNVGILFDDMIGHGVGVSIRKAHYNRSGVLWENYNGCKIELETTTVTIKRGEL